MNKRKKAFLIGNGINRALSDNRVKSWSSLLGKLNRSNKAIDLNNEFKPYPLLFEEILFKSIPVSKARNQHTFESHLKEVKELVATVYRDTPATALHKKLSDSRCNHILTTNYDYAFEKAIDPQFDPIKAKLEKETKEFKFSIKRRKYFSKSNKSIWHIHGELHDNKGKNVLGNYSAMSIMIGYEHYTEYIPLIHNYIVGKKSLTKGATKLSLIQKLQKGKWDENDPNTLGHSWIDFFFATDLVIAGLDLDFSETHLWWLLNYRAMQMKRKDNIINNEIRFYYSKSKSDKPADIKRRAAHISLFDALGVKHIPIEIEKGKYEIFYKKLFEKECK